MSPPTPAPEISLALPAYNEEANIPQVVADARQALDAIGATWEILIVDDGSTDRTAERAAALASVDPRIRLVRHPANRRYAGACATALRECRGRHVAIMDSDGQCTAADLPGFRAKLDAGANLVMGWRRQRRDPVLRKLMTFVFKLLGRFWLRYPLHDLNCGFRVLDRRAADAIEIRQTLNLVNPELYVRARQAGLRLDEVEIRHFARRAGTTSHDLAKLGRIFRDVNRYLQTLSRDLAACPK